jgi:hypothetical protein
MRLTVTTRACLAATIAIFFAAAAAANDQTSLPSGASGVLGLFVGQWEFEVRILPQNPSDSAIEARGHGEGRWILDGRFVEFRTRSVPPGQLEIRIMTYDVETHDYRQWLFDARGYTHEAVGEWDPETKTLIWSGENTAGPFIINDRWVTPHRLEWRLRLFGPDGESVEPISGILTKVD